MSCHKLSQAMQQQNDTNDTKTDTISFKLNLNRFISSRYFHTFYVLNIKDKNRHIGAILHTHVSASLGWQCFAVLQFHKHPEGFSPLQFCLDSSWMTFLLRILSFQPCDLGRVPRITTVNDPIFSDVSGDKKTSRHLVKGQWAQ